MRVNLEITKEAPSEPYCIERELARGSRSTTFLAQHVRSGRTVLLDVLTSAAEADPAQRAQFWTEAQVSCGADPIRVVPRTAFVTNGRLAALSDVPVGYTLEAIGAPIDIDAAIRVCLDVALGVATIHRQGFVHAALRPSAIAARTSRHGVHATLTDVGYCLQARTATIAHLQARIPFAGNHFPPEALAGAPIDTSTDVYAFGALCYHLLTGRVWHPSAIVDLPDETPLRFAAIVMQCLSSVPAHRPRSMAAIASDLCQLSEDKGPRLVAQRRPDVAMPAPTAAPPSHVAQTFGEYADWFIDDDVTKLAPEKLASLIGYEPEPGTARARRNSRGMRPWVLGGAALLLSPAAAALVYLFAFGQGAP